MEKEALRRLDFDGNVIYKKGGIRMRRKRMQRKSVAENLAREINSVVAEYKGEEDIYPWYITIVDNCHLRRALWYVLGASVFAAQIVGTILMPVDSRFLLVMLRISVSGPILFVTAFCGLAVKEFFAWLDCMGECNSNLVEVGYSKKRPTLAEM